MKHTFLLLIGLLSATSLLGAQAQSAQTPAQRQQALQRAKNAIVDQKLGLTADQKTRTQQIRSKAAESVAAVRADASLPQADKQAQVQKINKETQAQWRALLTPAQKTQLSDIMSRPAQLTAQANLRLRTQAINRELELTAPQSASLRKLRTEAVQAAQTIRADTSLASADKQAKIREATANYQRQISSVLSPDQQSKLTQIRKRLLSALGPLAPL